jgi:hypothetical protein
MYCFFILISFPFGAEERYLSHDKILKLSVRFWVLNTTSVLTSRTTLYFNVCVRKAKHTRDFDLRIKGLGAISFSYDSLVHFVLLMGKRTIDTREKWTGQGGLAAH